jgi:hypothetical protein
MSSLDARLERLERAQAPTEMPPVRIFTCSGEAEDGSPSLADSPRPVNVPPGYVWAMTICGCAAEGLSGCRYRDAGDPSRFTIEIDKANADAWEDE